MIKRPTCPICNKTLPVEITGENAVFPFCSNRCKAVDLHRWLNGGYAAVEPLTPEQLEIYQRQPDDLDSLES